jgi:hypothetical protein
MLTSGALQMVDPYGGQLSWREHQRGEARQESLKGLTVQELRRLLASPSRRTVRSCQVDSASNWAEENQVVISLNARAAGGRTGGHPGLEQRHPSRIHQLTPGAGVRRP